MIRLDASRESAFDAAAAQIRDAKFRSELTVQEIAAPERIAARSIAIAAGIAFSQIESQSHDILDSPHGAGRFILLYDPDHYDEWDSDFRVVCYAQAPLEVEIGIDPFLTDVAWSWLVDALESRGAEYTNIAGTATKTVSAGYGQLAEQGEGAQLELRCSWSPKGESFAEHAEAWSELLCLLAGLPHQEGVASLGAHRQAKATRGAH